MNGSSRRNQGWPTAGEMRKAEMWAIQCTSRTAFVIAEVALKGSESSIASTEMQPFPKSDASSSSSLP